MNSEIGFRIGNRQLVAGCRFELAFLKRGSRIGGRVGDRIWFR